MTPVKTVAVIGCGTVGASWAALFLAHDLDVQATAPSPEAEAYLRRFVARARAQLAELGLTGTGKLSFSTQLADALQGADFVQENAPEKRSEEHTSELQSLMRISYAVFCLQKKIQQPHTI